MERIGVKSLKSFGNSKIVLGSDDIYVKAGKKSGVCTPNFQAFHEKTVVKIQGETEVGSNIEYALYSFDANKTETLIYSKRIKVTGDNCFEFEHIFDPVSLAIYRNAESFRVVLYSVSEHSCFYINEFSLSEGGENFSHSCKPEKQISNIVDLKDGKKGVYVLQKSGEKIIVPIVPKEVLFIGNSILLGMFGKYGMCASSPQKDYSYYVQQKILEHNKSCVFKKLMGSGFEHAESIKEFEDWFYHNANSYSQKPARESFTKDLDLIYIQLSDNVNTEKKILNFYQTADILIEKIKELSPRARIIWIHGWYNKCNTYDKIIELCTRWNIERIDISDLRMKENEAFSGQICENASGETMPVKETWITHPGDTGMKKIAERINKITWDQ